MGMTIRTHDVFCTHMEIRVEMVMKPSINLVDDSTDVKAGTPKPRLLLLGVLEMNKVLWLHLYDVQNVYRVRKGEVGPST